MESVSQALVQEFFSTVKTEHVEPKVNQISPEVDRDLYLAMKSCKACASMFDKHSNKKYYCHFCYSAFCEKCCFLQVMHPESAKFERSCAGCYLAYTKENVLIVSEEFVQEKLKQEIEDRKKEERLNEEVRLEIGKVREIMKEEKLIGEKELEKLDKEIKEEEIKTKGKELTILQMKAKLETPTGNENRSTPTGKTGCMDCSIF
jgi:hypothetical protein